jgi:hypothetical protein
MRLGHLSPACGCTLGNLPHAKVRDLHRRQH